ncbi:lipid A export permease/ATP-binding protein MsbA [Methylophilus medardicus]|uniref:Lipid A export permease/ATP-binding protein MsbA n=1 Tax=Methylophilus medardicus TaxID=2588534 RepID=A0A5B8CRE9_9PROT|nr:lipid A export permease/ATP-binding protein MsbA [Methylophilus medardicus]QDC43670.1 lipid A export permease/ATP-binding protein MsbA [Methylophilus medardicus]QDC48677.1 lipid A export permease/ATP-binding protein MsbA [Methylophilus medardicus]QDC52382.1 lipid A export permease/ATP-binding protein MsbA [Methylophilus medardicus]
MARKSSPDVVITTHPALLYKRLFAYAWHYKMHFAISMLSTAILASSNTLFLALIKKVTDEGFAKSSADEAYVLPLMLFGLMAIRAVAGFFSVYSLRTVARRVVEVLRKQIFAKLLMLPVSFFDANSNGLLVSKMTYDIERLSTVVTRSALNVLRDVLTVIGLIGYMLYLDWRLTLIFALVAPLMGLYLSRTTPKLRANAKKVQQAVGEITKTAEEAIAAQRIVKIFGAQAFENERFGEVVSRNRQLELRTARISGLNSFVIEILSALALGLVVFYALAQFTVGEFAAFVGALMMLIAPIKHITSANEDLQIGLAAAQSVFDVLDIENEVDQGSYRVARTQGALRFEQVTVRYPQAKSNALSSLSFEIQAGEKIALVGRSGSGKTTLVNLLPRFYEAQAGQVLLDGKDVRAYQLDNLRAQFSLVSQDIVLFNDTIFNNIAYGALRDASEQEVIDAAIAANAWEFIQQMPQGLQSEIGDRGVRLSGGQRQRLAIARAILKNAPVLLLDEATSALDSESELHVQMALDRLMRNRTTIVIAHRLSTVENADRIFVMDHGAIVESGSHQTLLAENGYYSRLYHKQFQED